MKRTLVAAVLCGCLVASCAKSPKVSDTGYSGTWSRGNSRFTSTISIFPVGDEVRFRLSVENTGLKSILTCDWDGNCTERVGDGKTREYRFRTGIDPETGHLMVEYDITGAATGAPLERYLDELILEPGGLGLLAYTVERNGVRFEGGRRPLRKFAKVSDEVASPPAGGSP